MEHDPGNRKRTKRPVHPNSLKNLQPRPKLPPGVEARTHRTLGEPIVLEWWGGLTPVQRGAHLARMWEKGDPPESPPLQSERVSCVHRTAAAPEVLDVWAEATPQQRGEVLRDLLAQLRMERQRERERCVREWQAREDARLDVWRQEMRARRQERERRAEEEREQAGWWERR